MQDVILACFARCSKVVQMYVSIKYIHIENINQKIRILKQTREKQTDA